MDGIIHLPLFLISSVLIVMAPGPDFIYVTTRGVAEGSKAGVLSALGISTGLLIHTMFAAFGLSALIQSSMAAYMVIKFLGAGYLIYLGIKALLSRSDLNNITLHPAKKTGVFNQGVLTNVFNPKAIVTFVAFLPQFVDETIVNPISQFFELGIMLSFIAVAWFGVIGFFAGLIGEYIKRNSFVQKTIKYLSGTVMIALGLKAALNKD
jgi:threonine/homoserine/homoserine lactone efflux protein